MSKEKTPVLTHRLVQDLGRFRPTPYLVTTLYLDTSRATPGSPARSATLKALIRDAKAGLDDRGLGRKQRQSVEEDLAALERIARDAQARGDRSVVAFVSSGVDFERTHRLPHPVKSRLMLDATPYVRPLVAALAEYPRYLVVLADRCRARLLAVHMGHVETVDELRSEVPGQVKEGGYQGNAERSIERHIDEQVVRHLKKLVGVIRASFGDHDYDHLVLGGPGETTRSLRDLLTADLRAALAGELPLPLEASVEEVAGACGILQAARTAERDRELLESLDQALSSTGLGTAGVLATLGALRRGAVATLLVAQDYEVPGTECKGCGFLGLEGEAVCPACGSLGSRAVPDLVREMLDRAVDSGARVCHVGGEPSVGRLRGLGGVATLLRFRLV